MTIAKALLEAVTIVGAELLATAVFLVARVLIPINSSKATDLVAAGWTTVSSPFYWLLVVGTVTEVVWLFRR